MILPSIQIRTNGPPGKVLREGLRRYFVIVEEEMKRGGAELRKEVQADTRTALGPKIANTWRRPELFLGRRDNFRSRVRVRTTVPHIIGAHSQDTTIKAKRKGSLAIPLPPLSRMRGQGAFRRQRLTPETYQKTFNVELQWIPAKKGGGLVLVDPGKKGKSGHKAQAVFYLPPKDKGVSLKKRLNVKEIERRVARKVQQRIRRRFARESEESRASASKSTEIVR